MSDKLLWVLITLMTINVTTSSVIMTKLREIVDATGGSFPDSVNELRLVFKEYLWMIIIAFLVSVAEDSVLLSKYLPLFDFVVNVVLTTILGYAIYVLYDLAKSIFILLEYEHNNSGWWQAMCYIYL